MDIELIISTHTHTPKTIYNNMIYPNTRSPEYQIIQEYKDDYDDDDGVSRGNPVRSI